ncbi:MAG: FAD:protein FMN transferase [Herpetosiphonaceae bacterium]|nr:FAD:protein FMN transferase [Herpetosiphonaceae bacterium]
MQCLSFRAMGCEMRALMEGEPALVDQELAAVPGWFTTWEQHLSRFRDDSELSLLNRTPDRWTSVSPVLWDVVGTALHAAAMSDGLVSPTVLAALEATGYDRSFELLSTSGAQHAPAATPPPVMSWWTLQRDAEQQALRLPAGMRLDLGGIAKGWAAEQAAARLGRTAPALVDAGGDIAVSGPLDGGVPWSIGVADPMAPEADLELLLLRQGVVATSGRDYRRWLQAGMWQHHIVDPRTGTAAVGDTVSATVVAPTACDAEVAAKVVMILGSRAGIAWLDARPVLAGLLVLEDGQVLRSRRLVEYVA